MFGKAKRGAVSERSVPAVRCGSDAESGGDIVRDAAGQQILRDRRFRMLMQLRGVPGGKLFIDGVNAFALTGMFLRLTAFFRIGVSLLGNDDGAF